jgi:type VII secretion integral membrane protein EccD
VASEGSCAVTVVGTTRRADLALPSRVSVAELLPELVRLLEDHSIGSPTPRRWSLLRLGGEPLDGERSLDDQGVLDGTMLFLRDTTTPSPAPVVEDIVESVAIAVELRAGRWTVEWAQYVLLGAAAASGVGAAAMALSIGPPPQRAAWAVAGALALTAGAASARLAARPLVAAVLALAALPSWAVAGAALAAGSQPGGPLWVEGAAAGIAAGALAAWAVSRSAAGPAVAALMVAVPLAVVAAVGGALRVGVTGQAAVTAVLLLAIADQLPRLSALLAGLSPSAGSTPAMLGPVAARVERAHRLLAWLLAGVGLGLAGAMATVAAGQGVVPRVLCAALAAAVALRARRYRFTAEVLPLTLAALAGAAALAWALAGDLRSMGAAGPPAMLAALLGATAAWTALALAAPRVREPSPRLRQQLDRLEATVNIALVPLVAAVLGLFGFASDLARRLS